MKKVFLALAAVALLVTACNKAPEAKIKVYGWQGEGGNTTEETLQADFSKWKSHGLDGMCYNAGHDLQKIQRAAKWLTQTVWNTMLGYRPCYREAWTPPCML